MEKVSDGHARRRMNVVTALNGKYVRYTYVMLLSLFQNNPDTDIRVYLLHGGLTISEKDTLLSLVKAGDNSIHFIELDCGSFPSALPTTQMWSLETYFRLQLADIIPLDVDRLLYLDVDMIVNQPLWELYTADFEGYFFCACRDMSAIYPFPDSRNDIFKEHMASGRFTYFNAGMMLWNMEALRGKYTFRDYMELAKRLNYQMAAPDQDLLNYMHFGQVKFLDEYRYNLFAKMAYNHDIHYEQAKREAGIVHFAGMKPWEGEYVHYDIEQLWWDYAKQTPFYAELMEEFLDHCLNSSMVYDTLCRLSEEKRQLQEELDKSRELCQKLYRLING